MKVTYYNQVYGTHGRGLFGKLNEDGKKLSGNLRTHLWHILGFPEMVRKKSDVNSTLDLMKNLDSDVAVISEVLGETQRKEILVGLNEQGYKNENVHVGRGHKLGRSNQFVEMILATKQKSIVDKMPNFNLPNKWGYGGGLIAAYIPKENCYVLSVHLAHPRKKRRKYFLDQLKFVKKKLKEKLKEGKKVLLIGDFNSSLKCLIDQDSFFGELERLSLDEPTCSTTPIFKNFCYECLDYILGKGYQLEKGKIVEGLSDHKAVHSELSSQ